MSNVERRSFFEPWRIGVMAVTLGVAVLLAGVGMPFLDDDQPADDIVVRKQVIDPPRELSNFTLTSHTGDSMSLSDLRGKPALLFFGYANCPDICPLTMAEFRQVKAELGDAGDEVNFVFISVDGSRDTPEVVANFVSQFDPSFIGLTGDEEEIRAIGDEYSLFFQRAEPEAGTTDLEYLVDHTGYSYLIDGDGRLRIIYPFDTSTDLMAEDVQALLE